MDQQENRFQQENRTLFSKDQFLGARNLLDKLTQEFIKM